MHLLALLPTTNPSALRFGEGPQYGMIHNLTYGYTGNQLDSVNDYSGDQYQNNGFSDNNSTTGTEYTYDPNGNMITDLYKNLTVNRYNYLNLLEQIQISMNGLNHINYLYSASVTKLAKHTTEDGVPQHTTDYVGSFVYEEGQLQYILTEEGRIVFAPGGTHKYQYFLKDHLGNTRVTFGEGGIIQEDSYYPFGMAMAGLSYQTGEDLRNKYLYNGKELQDNFGLEWYDYGFRFYDPALARWHSVDPRADKYFSNSPYNYCVNNPMLYVDPQGDTINISQAMLNEEQAMAAHNEWKTSRAGKRFYKRYGVGGKHENVSVNLDISSDGDATGGTSTFAVDKETGKETRIYPSRSLEAMEKEGLNIDGKRSSLLKGEYLKFNVTFDPPSKYNTSELQNRWNIRKGLTILHETQHVRMMHNDILNYGYMYYSGFDQHYFMKDTKLEHFQERFNYYREKQPGYSNEKINKIINNFEYGRF